MISGVELGKDKTNNLKVEILATSKSSVNVEVWLDDIGKGKPLAIIPVTATGGENNWKTFNKGIKNLSGHHDVFIKFPKGSSRELFIKTIRFVR